MVLLEKVLEYYGVPFNPSRNSQRVRCAIHDDHEPSMAIDLEKGVFYCHACEAKGSAVGFIMQKEGIDDHGRARSFAASHGLTDGETGGRDQPVPGRATRRGGRLARSSGDRRGDGSPGGYIPSWRR